MFAINIDMCLVVMVTPLISLEVRCRLTTVTCWHWSDLSAGFFSLCMNIFLLVHETENHFFTLLKYLYFCDVFLGCSPEEESCSAVVTSFRNVACVINSMSGCKVEWRWEVKFEEKTGNAWIKRKIWQQETHLNFKKNLRLVTHNWERTVFCIWNTIKCQLLPPETCWLLLSKKHQR